MRAFDFLRDPVATCWDRARTFELSRRFVAPAASGVLVLAVIASWTAIDAGGLRSARAAEVQARTRVARLERRIEGQQISRAARESSARREGRLQEIRQSGFWAAERVARLGNAVEDGASATSIVLQASNPSTVRGSAPGVQQLATLVANLTRDPTAGGIAAVRFSTDTHGAGGVAFELQLEDSARGAGR